MFPQGRIFNNFQFQDTLTHTVGNHTLRFGTDILMQRAKQFVPINTRGTLTFAAGGGFPAFGNFVDSFSGVGTGAAAKVFGAGTDFPNVTTYAFFINDTWKVRPNLTLNFGLRYERFGAVANNAAFPAFTGFDAPLQTRVEQQQDNNNLGPRFSFAYSPNFNSGWARRVIGENKTVIRGGFAINYDVFFNNILSNIIATSPNALGTTVQGATIGGRGIPNFTEAALPATLVANPQAGQNAIPADLKNPQTYVWNFGIQRELPGHNVLDVAYVGTRGTRLFINEQLNPGIPGSRMRMVACLLREAQLSRARTAATRGITVCRCAWNVVSETTSCIARPTPSKRRSTTRTARSSRRLAAIASVRILSIDVSTSAWPTSMCRTSSRCQGCGIFPEADRAFGRK